MIAALFMLAYFLLLVFLLVVGHRRAEAERVAIIESVRSTKRAVPLGDSSSGLHEEEP